MRICADRRRGVTLVELIVVIFIVGLIGALAALTAPPLRAGLNDQASEVARRANWARLEAITTGELIGLEISNEDYAFFRYRLGEWRPIDSDRNFARFTWKDRTIAILRRNGRTAPFETRDFAVIEAPPAPQVWFHPTGDVTPFSLRIERRGRIASVTGDAAGEIEVVRDNAR